MTTKAYEMLLERPRTSVTRNELNYQERMEFREISIGGRNSGRTNTPGRRLQPIYYLAGDEDRAAERFVMENGDLLREIDFSQRNVVGDSVSRDVYDLILHHLGERVIEKFLTVVYERRSDGSAWLIRRDIYDYRPNRRYNRVKAAYVPPSVSLENLYEELGPIISVPNLVTTDVEGKRVRVLDYYCDASAFDCTPITLDDGSPAIESQ